MLVSDGSVGLFLCVFSGSSSSGSSGSPGVSGSSGGETTGGTGKGRGTIGGTRIHPAVVVPETDAVLVDVGGRYVYV